MNRSQGGWSSSWRGGYTYPGRLTNGELPGPSDMRNIFTTVLVAAFASTLALGAARAEDKAPAKDTAGKAKEKATTAKGDPSGTWTWSFAAPNGQSFDQTATLKREGDKLSGTITSRRGDAPIADGSFKDGQVTFSVTRERDGRKMTAKYTGKLEGDGGVIKGTSIINRGDGERTVPWEAKRK
jgi:hypothetical protein